jgi:hypothetical protein
MTRKSPRIFIQILLFVLLLGTSATAYADAIAITSGSLSNIQIVPTSGTVVFTTPSATAAGAVVSDGFDDSSNRMESPTRSEASLNLGFANAAAVSDLTNFSLSANSSVILSGCRCQFETEGQAFLSQSFMITGGSGNVAVNLSALLSSMQSVMTDQFSLFAASSVIFNLQVLNASDFSPVHNFSFRNRFSVLPPDNSSIMEFERQLSEAFTLQFGTEYSLRASTFANSEAAQSEIPEPASVVLLVSGLGFMAGFVKKRRTR